MVARRDNVPTGVSELKHVRGRECLVPSDTSTVKHRVCKGFAIATGMRGSSSI